MRFQLVSDPSGLVYSYLSTCRGYNLPDSIEVVLFCKVVKNFVFKPMRHLNMVEEYNLLDHL